MQDSYNLATKELHHTQIPAIYFQSMFLHEERLLNSLKAYLTFE